MGLDNFGIKMVVSKDSFGRQSQNERSMFKKGSAQVVRICIYIYKFENVFNVILCLF